MKNTYKNRYGDIFTFTKDDNNDILWEGNFEYCRIGYLNDYTKSYNIYLSDGGDLSFNEFKAAIYDYPKYRKYVELVESLKDKIDMVDPSGGPYIAVNMDLGHYGYKLYKVVEFERIETGYKIITEKCYYCHKPGAIHKMSCPTQKIQINL
jgi:hypothetical protein